MKLSRLIFLTIIVFFSLSKFKSTAEEPRTLDALVFKTSAQIDEGTINWLDRTLKNELKKNYFELKYDKDVNELTFLVTNLVNEKQIINIANKRNIKLILLKREILEELRY